LASLVALAVIAEPCVAQGAPSAASESGFLRDYSSLQQTTDAAGTPVRSWVSSKLSPANYNAILLDPLVFYPEPRPTDQVSAEELRKMLAYSNAALRRPLSQRFRVVDRAGKGVVRVRIAFSGIAVQGEGLRPFQYIPIAFVATMAARTATGGSPQRAFILVETEATDSVTGEFLGERVRAATGERLPVGQKVITADSVKPLLEELAAHAFPELARYVRPK